MEARTINIITNLELNQVSWARAFINNSCLPFVSVSDEFSHQADINIFIGDNIPWSDFKKHSSFIVYFLAATSFNRQICGNKVSKEIETENIRRADMVVLTSSAELALLKQANLGINLEKVIIAGFPIDPSRYVPYKKMKKNTDICFISDLSDIKNPGFHYELIAFLKKQGYTISHFHTSEIMPDKGIELLECTVYKRLPHKEFIKKLAEHHYCINVSKYESLSVSSVEAALLGCIPICPAHSGFLDWCNPRNLYVTQNCKTVSTILPSARPINRKELEKYNYYSFYEKILSSSLTKL